jgi:hypothetical protein
MLACSAPAPSSVRMPRDPTRTEQPNGPSILLIKQEFVPVAERPAGTNQLALVDAAEWMKGIGRSLPSTPWLDGPDTAQKWGWAK